MALISRRRLIQFAPLLGASLASAQAQQQLLLREEDAEAKAVDYHVDASKIDKAKSPKYMPGQTCANCSLYAPDGDKPTGGCALFYDKDVEAKAWCNAWEKKA